MCVCVCVCVQGCIQYFFLGGGGENSGTREYGGTLPQEIFVFRLSETASGAFSGTLYDV